MLLDPAYVRQYVDLVGRGKPVPAVPELRIRGTAERPNSLHPLNVRAETTYGYTPLILTRYQEYVDAMRTNPKLRAGLNVGMRLDPASGTLRTETQVLPRAHFPPRFITVSSPTEAKQRLAALDPAEAVIIPDAIAVAAQDGSGVADVIAHEPGHYTIRYRCSSPSVLRVSNAWFPGWTARLNEEPLDVFPVDHALLGVVVPAGEGEIELTCRSTYFPLGALVTVASLLGCCAVLARRSR